MSDTLRTARLIQAAEKHESAAERVSRLSGQPGITKARVHLQDACHARMRAELEASRGEA